MAFMDNFLHNIEGIAGKIMGKSPHIDTPLEEVKQETRIVNNDQELLTQILKKINELMEGFNQRLTQLEGKFKELDAKANNETEMTALKEEVNQIHTTLEEFSKLYELVCRQYDPFAAEKTSLTQIATKPSPSASESSVAIQQDSQKSFTQQKANKKETDLLGNQIAKKEKIYETGKNDNDQLKLIEEFNKVLAHGNNQLRKKDHDGAEKAYTVLIKIYKQIHHEEKAELYKHAVNLYKAIKASK